MSFQLEGRTAVVFGVANKRSIAWSIAQGLHAAGMQLAITYQNERLAEEARDLIDSLPGAKGSSARVPRKRGAAPSALQRAPMLAALHTRVKLQRLDLCLTALSRCARVPRAQY